MSLPYEICAPKPPVAPLGCSTCMFQVLTKFTCANAVDVVGDLEIAFAEQRVALQRARVAQVEVVLDELVGRRDLVARIVGDVALEAEALVFQLEEAVVVVEQECARARHGVAARRRKAEGRVRRPSATANPRCHLPARTGSGSCGRADVELVCWSFKPSR